MCEFHLSMSTDDDTHKLAISTRIHGSRDTKAITYQVEDDLIRYQCTTCSEFSYLLADLGAFLHSPPSVKSREQ